MSARGCWSRVRLSARRIARRHAVRRRWRYPTRSGYLTAEQATYIHLPLVPPGPVFGGGAVLFSKVLAVFPDEGEALLGEAASSHKITATITANGRGKKILVFKFKRKKQYKRTIGHRQNYTRLEVQEILP